MSLQHIAKHLETKGRGNDTELIHMSKREIGGLQALAKAHGGSLTKNPETGLYEAGFLEQVLPIVAAAAATYFTAGAAAPMLMSAGMGATSAGILAGAGAGALIGGGSAAIQGKDAGQAALMGGVGGAITGGLGGFGGAEGAAADGATAAVNAPVDQATIVGTNAINVNPTTGAAIDPLAGTTQAAADPYAGLAGTTPAPAPTQPGIPSLAPQASVPPQGSGLTVDQMIAGSGRPELSGTNNAFDPYAKIPGENLASPQTKTDTGWWAKQSPWEKAGYTTAAAGLASAVAGNAGTNMAPTNDTSDDGNYLARISPNFRAQQPVQPNPYYRARYPVYAAEGGIMRLANGGPTGPVERMSQNALGGGTNMYPQSQQERTNFATPTQMPASAEVIRNNQYAGVTMADGGIATLGSYSDGGRLLKGPGDGVSDNIPATIGGHQPARLADGEFVVPARIVSELGNGSTDAGAKRLYAMMERVQAKRKKSIGKGKFAVNSKAEKDLPA